MSTEAVADGAEGEAPAAKPGKKKLFIIIGVAVLALAGSGGAWWFMGKSKAGAEEHPAEESKAKAKAHVAAVYHKFEPAFVVNFGGEGNSRYLQVTVEAMSRSPEVVELIKTSEPVIRNDLVLLFSSQQYDVLVSAEGKEKLRQATLEAIRKAVAAEGAKPEEVEGVYFTSFVIQ
jgi:flagellar FliL protein